MAQISDLTSDNIMTMLQNTSIFSSCSNMDFSRLLPYVTVRQLEDQELLFQTGSSAKTLYIIIEGKISLMSGKRQVKELSSGSVGEEVVNLEGKYLNDAFSVSETKVLSVPRENLNSLFEENNEFKKRTYNALIDHYTFKQRAHEKKEAVKTEKAQPGLHKLIGWIMAIVMPALFLYIANQYSLDWKIKIFVTLSLSTIAMWIFRLASEFVPCLFAVLVILILDVAPPSVALSGFTSGSFFMALSIFGLSAVLISSGLTYRIVITILKYLPLSQFWYSLSILFTGIFLTPLLPSANGRISLASPILTDMSESLGYEKSGPASTRLSVSTFAGFTMFSSVFLSSKSINFVVFGLLPIQIREQFNWGYWLYASMIVGFVIFGLHMIYDFFIFRNKEIPRLSKEQISAQHKVLGPMSTQEWAALAGILLFLAGIATQGIHKIQLPWIGLTVLYIVLALEFLSKKEFRVSIDWTFLIFLGTLIGYVKTMSYIGLDEKIGSYLIWVGEYSTSNFPVFVLLLSVSVLLLRLFIPNNATVAILVSVFLPIAIMTGINPWIVGFIILTMSDAWLLPYQSTYYLLFDELTAKKKLFNQTRFLRYNFVTVLFRLAAIYASIPFWRYIGIL